MSIDACIVMRLEEYPPDREKRVSNITEDGFLVMPDSAYMPILKGNDVVIVGLLDRFEVWHPDEWDHVSNSNNVDVDQFNKLLKQHGLE